MRRKTDTGTDVFVSVTGQRDNVGDTVLRRHLLDALRPHGTMHLWIGTLPDTYLSGLQLEPSDVLYRSRRRWRLAAMRRAVAGHVLFAFHGGEITLTRAVLRSYVLNVPVLLALRLRSGTAIHTSIGVRADNRVLARALRSVLSLCDLVTWRDDVSRGWIGIGSVAPDWAFGEQVDLGPLREDDRTVLAVALRHDRPAPTSEYVQLVREVAAAHDLEIVMTAQTGRDLKLAKGFAPAFGARVCEWPGDDLLGAERALRQVYRASFAVVSNRLHGLIMAATEGAVPVGLGTSDVTKLDRSLRAAGLGSVALHVRDLDQSRDFVEKILGRREDIRKSVVAAADAVSAMSGRIADLEARR